MTTVSNDFMRACEHQVSVFKAEGLIDDVVTIFIKGGEGERLAFLTNAVGREKALAILISEIDCDSDYDDSVGFKHGEIDRIFARSGLSATEAVQFKKQIEEHDVKAKADPEGESATLIKEIRAGHKAFERLRNLETEICALYELIESDSS